MRIPPIFHLFTGRWNNQYIIPLFLTFLLYLLMNGLRTTRFYKIFDQKIALFRMYEINSYHNLFNHTVPYRVGELSLLYYTDKAGISSQESMAKLLFLRAFDFIISTLLLIISTAVFTKDYLHPEIYWIACILLGSISVGLIIALYRMNWLVSILDRINQKIHLHLVSKIIEWIIKVGNEIHSLKGKYSISHYFLFALAIRILQLLITVLTFLIFQINIPVYAMILNDLFLAFVELLPLSLIANLGYFEYTYNVMLSVEGLGEGEGYNIGFLRHILNFLFIFAYAGLMWILRQLYKFSQRKAN